MSINKKNFTLIEVLISAAIGAVVIGMVITVSIQLYGVNRDCLADMLLTQNSSLIRQKLLKTYKLSQANYKSIVYRNNLLRYRAPSSNSEWPSVKNCDEDYELTLSNGNLIIDTDGKSENVISNPDIFVEKLLVEKVDGDPTSNSDPVLNDNKGMKITILLGMHYSGEIYYREETLNTVIYNGKTSIL